MTVCDLLSKSSKYGQEKVGPSNRVRGVGGTGKHTALNVFMIFGPISHACKSRVLSLSVGLFELLCR